MKTVKELQRMLNNEISANKHTAAVPRGKENAKINASIQHLKMCLYYIETKPKESFLKSEKERLTNLIIKIDKGMDYFITNVSPKHLDYKQSIDLYKANTIIINLINS